MLAVTLVCLVIVLYPREEIERYGKQAIAAEALSRIGGVEVGQIPLPNNGYTYFLSWFIPRSHLCHVTTVSAERSVITNQDMRHLPNLPNLERVYLAGNHQITDEGIEHLAGCHRLRRASLWSTNITDNGLHVFQNKDHLELIDISLPKSTMDSTRTKLSNLCLAHFEGLPSLKKILFDFPIRDQDLPILTSIPHFQTEKLTVESISDYGIDDLTQFHALKKVTLTNEDFLQADFLSLLPLKRLPNLEELSIEGQAVGDQHLAGIRELKQLKRLSLAKTSATNWIVEQLEDHPNLEHLNVGRSNVNCDVINKLAGAKFTIGYFPYDATAIKASVESKSPSKFRRCFLSENELSLLLKIPHRSLQLNDLSDIDSPPTGIDRQPNPQPFNDGSVSQILSKIKFEQIELSSSKLSLDCLRRITDFSGGGPKQIHFTHAMKSGRLLTQPNPHVIKAIIGSSYVSLTLGPSNSLELPFSKRNTVTAQIPLPHKSQFDLAFLKYLPNLRVLHLSYRPDFDGDFQHLEYAPQLQNLSFNSKVRINLQSLQHISRLGKLKDLQCCLAKDPQFGKFTGPLNFESLQNLYLSLSPEHARLLPVICKIETLTGLQLVCRSEDFQLSPQQTAGLPNLQNLKSLTLCGVTDESMAHVCQLKKLKYIDLSGKLTAKSLPHINSLPKTAYFSTHGTGLTRKQIESFGR